MDRILIILKKENGPRASSAPALGLNTMIFKYVYWYMKQISGERLQDHWPSCLFFLSGTKRILDKNGQKMEKRKKRKGKCVPPWPTDLILCYGIFQGCMCSDPCVERTKEENFIKLSIFFIWINVLHIYVRIVNICLFRHPVIILKK